MIEIQTELFCLYPVEDSCKLDSQKSAWVVVKSDYFHLVFAYFFLTGLLKFPKKPGKRGVIPYHATFGMERPSFGAGKLGSHQ